MQSKEKTAGKTARNGGARCVSIVNAMNAGLAIGGAVMVAKCAEGGAMHALILGALISAASGCVALVAIAGRRFA